MKRQLHLTSPLMRGADVEYARNLLTNLGYLIDVPNDNRWDEEAAAATRRAKFEMGYPERHINGAFGTKIERYLRGEKLPFLYRQRAAKRAKERRGFGKAMLAEARRWEGTKERPAGSNIAKPFTEWYGWHGWGAPWCAVFVSYCLSKAGFKYVAPNAERWAYCPYFLADARAKRNGLQVVAWARAQDAIDKGVAVIALFDWDNDGVADHIGMVEAIVGSVAHCWEGNTAFGNDSNGGEVMFRDRYRTDIIALVKAG